MRLLTLVCFFQFSGLNSGYTLLCEVSPLNVSKSVLPVQAFAAGFRGVSHLSGLTDSLNSGRRWIIDLALGVEGFFASLEAPASFTGKKGFSTVSPAVSAGRKSLSVYSGEKKEEYLKQEKENWVRPKVWPPFLSEVGTPNFLAARVHEFEGGHSLLMGHDAPMPWTVPKICRQRLHFSTGDEDPAHPILSGLFSAVTPEVIRGDFFRLPGREDLA